MIFFKLFLYLIFVLLLIFLSIYYLKYKIFELISLILFMLPLLLLKRIMKFYTREVEITLNDESILFLIKQKDKSDENFEEIQLKNIKQYKVLFVNRRFVDTVFYLKGNKVLQYSFLKEIDNSNKIGGDTLIQNFQDLIKNYNERNITLPKIQLLPSFYASTFGFYSIFLLILLFTIAVILHIIYSIKTLPISLFLGGVIIMQLVLRRKNDLAFYKKNQ